MKKKYWWIVGIIVILSILIIGYLALYQKNNQSDTQTGILDLSNSFKISPNESYSIKLNMIENVPPSTPGQPTMFGITIPYWNDYSDPLWFVDCNNEGLLQIKTISDWKDVDKVEECKGIGSFINRGMNKFYFVLTLEEGMGYTPIDRTGTYRVKADLDYGCEATNQNGVITYTNCKGKAVAYSPEFKIVD